MAKKRKSQATNLDEVDRTMYSTFCSGANSLSQLYTQAMNQQKLSFQAGERHGLEKLYQWILRQQEGGSRVTTVDILTYLQTDPDCCGGEPSMSPRAPLQNQHSQATCVFSDALSSPVRRSLQNYHIAQEDYYSNDVQVQSSANGVRNNEPNFVEHQNRDSDPFNNDSSMDMHSDSPGHESTY